MTGTILSTVQSLVIPLVGLIEDIQHKSTCGKLQSSWGLSFTVTRPLPYLACVSSFEFLDDGMLSHLWDWDSYESGAEWDQPQLDSFWVCCWLLFNKSELVPLTEKLCQLHKYSWHGKKKRAVKVFLSKNSSTYYRNRSGRWLPHSSSQSE